MNKPVIQDWVSQLPYMQQSVLLMGVRGMDGLPKSHSSKPMLRWLRRTILITAFEGKVLKYPHLKGGGSFTGPSCILEHKGLFRLFRKKKIWQEAMIPIVDNFLNNRDEYNVHFFMHFVHACEIIGYKHPDYYIRIWWYELYIRLVHSLHLEPETKQQMEKRLGDNEDNWLSTSDTSETKTYIKNKGQYR